MFLKDKREYLIVLFTVIAFFVDLLGRVFAEKLMLPLWCDSVGTFFIAYFAPFVGDDFVGARHYFVGGDVILTNGAIY